MSMQFSSSNETFPDVGRGGHGWWYSKTKDEKVLWVALGITGVLAFSFLIATVALASKGSKEIFVEKTNSCPPSSNNTYTYCRGGACGKAERLLNRMMNSTLKPCDDFYSYVCQNTEGVYPIDSGYASSPLLNAQEEVLEELSVLLELLLTSDDVDIPPQFQTMVDFYRSCVVTEDYKVIEFVKKSVIEKYGGWPIASKDASGMNVDVLKLIPMAHRDFDVSILLQLTTMPDITGTDKYILALTRPYLLEPPIPEFLSFNQTHIQNVVCLIYSDCATFPHLKDDTDKMISLNEELKTLAMVPPKEGTDFKMTVADLQKKIKDSKINALEYLKSFTEGSNKITVNTELIADLDYINALIQKLGKYTPRDISNYFIYALLSKLGPKFGGVIFESQKPYYSVHVKSVSKKKATCQRIVNNYMPYAVAAAYVARYWDDHEEIILEIQNLYEENRKSIGKMFNSSSWLDVHAKTKFIEKLNNMRVLIGFPSWILDSKKLEEFYKIPETAKGDYMKTASALMALSLQKTLAKNGVTIDRSNDWHLAGSNGFLDINAWNFPKLNNIHFPLGFLRFPIYEPKSIRPWTYGALGSVIAHEILHSFDPNGIHFGVNGYIVPESIIVGPSSSIYAGKLRCLIDQYSQTFIDGAPTKTPVGGERTITEDMPDNVGIQAAYEAYLSTKELDNARLGNMNFTPEQLFYVFHTLVWCEAYTPDYLPSVLEDVHSLNKYRILLSYQNSPQFSKAFNCPVGSNMNKRNKCNIF